MKKALKVLAIVFGCLIVLFAVILIGFISKLPSSYQIKQALSPKAAAPAFESATKAPAPNTLPQKAPEDSEAKPVASQQSRLDDAKEISRKAMHEDFLNDRQPLASVCAHLDRAAESRFLKADENANSKEFMKKLTDPIKDPLIEAAAPAFRYILRRPGVRNLIDMVEKAQAENENDFMQKASFYTQMAIAANDVRSSKPELDQVLMKSYNMYVLSKAVAKSPALARDPATLRFCEQIEKNLNDDLEYNADQQAEELQKFLASAEIAPADVGYDPKYRSDVTFSFKNNSILLDNIWIEKLFAEDMKKAGKEIEKSLPPPTN